MILQQRNGRRKCTKTKVKNSSFRNKYDRVEAEDPEDVIAKPKNKGDLISECIIRGVFRTFELRLLTVIDCPKIAGAKGRLQ